MKKSNGEDVDGLDFMCYSLNVDTNTKDVFEIKHVSRRLFLYHKSDKVEAAIVRSTCASDRNAAMLDSLRKSNAFTKDETDLVESTNNDLDKIFNN